ncbi:MAG: hypothetical protein ABI559_12100 [Chloroflexota bacterium]
MPAKKKAPAKKRTAPKVAEAAPKYTARSSGSLRKQDVSEGEALWKAYVKLPETERGAFVQKMLGSRQRREDIMDIAVSIARRGEVGRSYSEIREELKRDGLL